MTRSAKQQALRILGSVADMVMSRPPKTSSMYCRRLWEMSKTVTWAPRPRAILAALAPTTPAPMMTTAAGDTPGTPPSRMPRPPWDFSR